MEQRALPPPEVENEKILEILRRAKAFLAEEGVWYGPEEYKADLGRDDASRGWPEGSILTAFSDHHDRHLLLTAVYRVAAVVGCGSPRLDKLFQWSVQSGRTLEEVIAAFDETIRRIEAGESFAPPTRYKGRGGDRW